MKTFWKCQMLNSGGASGSVGGYTEKDGEEHSEEYGIAEGAGESTERTGEIWTTNKHIIHSKNVTYQ